LALRFWPGVLLSREPSDSKPQFARYPVSIVLWCTLAYIRGVDECNLDRDHDPSWIAPDGRHRAWCSKALCTFAFASSHNGFRARGDSSDRGDPAHRHLPIGFNVSWRTERRHLIA